MRTIAIINQKGGCGKTTTAINLSAVLAQKGHRTLLVDMDPQGHCALGLAVPDQQLDRTVADVMRAGLDGSIAFTDVVWQIARNLDLAPASMSLAGLEQELAGALDRDRRLLQVLAPVSDRYDYAIVDCPPSISLLTFNALRAANEVIIPVETGYFAMQGAMRQEATIQMLARRANHRVRFMVLASMYDARTKLAREILAELRRHFGARMLPGVVHFNSKLREAASFGQAITEYDPSCTGFEDFNHLAEWLVQNPPDPTPLEIASASLTAAPAPAPGSGGGSEMGSAVDPAAVASSAMVGAADGAPVQESMGAGPGATTATHHPPLSAAPALSRAAELVERARMLAARTAALSARFGADPIFTTPAKSAPLQPVARSPLIDPADTGQPIPPTPLRRPPGAVTELPATLTPAQASQTRASEPPAGPATVAETAPVTAEDAPALAPATAMPFTGSPRACVQATAPAVTSIAAPAPPVPPASPVPAAATPSMQNKPGENETLAQRLARLYGVRATRQGLLFVQPINGDHTLAVAGDFNHWNPKTHPLHRDEKLGVWQACIRVPPGRYRYRLVVDGKWVQDPFNQFVECNPFGELNNVIEASTEG